MFLETQHTLDIAAVIVLGTTAHAFVKKACLNKIRTKRLNDVEPNPGRVAVEEIGIAALNNLIGRVRHNINQRRAERKNSLRCAAVRLSQLFAARQLRNA
jgi:hypothetical protein